MSPQQTVTEAVDGELKTIEQVGETEQAVTTTDIEEAVAEEAGLAPKVSDEDVSVEDMMSDETIESDTQKESKKGVPAGVQKRIDRAVARERAAEREAQALKEKIRQLELERSAPRERPLAPDRDLYDTTSDWQEAMDKWQTDCRAFDSAKSNIERQQEVSKEQEKINADRFVEQAEQLKSKYPDVYDIIAETHYGNAKDYIANSEHNAKIGLYLALNHAALAKISTLTSPDAINREIGKLEARFSNIKTRTTSAPKPLNPLDAKSGVVQKDPSKMTDEEWFKWDRERRIKKFQETGRY